MVGHGTLVAVGGAEDKQEDMVILRCALDHVPGGVRRLEILPTASREPQEAAQLHAAAFSALGVPEVGILDVRTRDEAQLEEAVERVRAADLLYITGGDQARLATILRGTPLHQAIEEKLAAGGVVAGTSAGAAAMSGTMIAHGDASLRKGGVVLTPGLALVDRLVIDTHFAERGRFGRLVEAVAAHPHLVGIGIGENTAVVIRGGEMRVVGEGNVVVVDGGEMRGSNVHDVDDDRPVRVERLILHTLADGDVLRIPVRATLAEPAVDEAQA